MRGILRRYTSRVVDDLDSGTCVVNILCMLLVVVDAVDGTFSADFLCLILPVRLRAKDRSCLGSLV